jgi:hypothetical protein
MANFKFSLSYGILIMGLCVQLFAECPFGVQCGMRTSQANIISIPTELNYPIPSGMIGATGINPLISKDVPFLSGDFFTPKITDDTGRVWTCNSLRLKPNGDAFLVDSEKTLQRIFIDDKGRAFSGKTYGTPTELSRPKDERILIELAWAYINRKNQQPGAKLFLKNYFNIGEPKPLPDTQNSTAERPKESPVRQEPQNSNEIADLEEAPASRNISHGENTRSSPRKSRPVDLNFGKGNEESITEVGEKYPLEALTPANGWTEDPGICQLNGECTPRSWTRKRFGVSEKVIEKKHSKPKAAPKKTQSPAPELPKVNTPTIEVAPKTTFPVKQFTTVDSFNRFMNDEFPKQTNSMKRMIFLFSSPGPGRCGACTNLENALGGQKGLEKLSAENPGVQIVQVDAWAIDPSGQTLSKGWGFQGVPSVVVYDFNQGGFKLNNDLSRRATFNSQGQPLSPGASKDNIERGVKLP